MAKQIAFEKLIGLDNKDLDPNFYEKLRITLPNNEEPVVDKVYAIKEFFFQLLMVRVMKVENGVDTYYCIGKIVKL